MASRQALSRLIRPTTTSIPNRAARLSTTSPSQLLVSKNALLSTPLAQVKRTAPRMLVGEARRAASSESEGGSTMVRCLDLERGCRGMEADVKVLVFVDRSRGVEYRYGGGDVEG
jgi:hypothetical protein